MDKISVPKSAVNEDLATLHQIALVCFYSSLYSAYKGICPLNDSASHKNFEMCSGLDGKTVSHWYNSVMLLSCKENIPICTQVQMGIFLYNFIFCTILYNFIIHGNEN